MKTVAVFANQMEAHLAAEFLHRHGITATVRGSRAYATHVLGGDTGTFELVVNDTDAERSADLLKQTERKPLTVATATEPMVYFKRAIVMAVFATVLLPLICNMVSLRNLALYWRAEENPARRLVLSAIIVAAQIPGGVMAYWIWTLAPSIGA